MIHNIKPLMSIADLEELHVPRKCGRQTKRNNVEWEKSDEYCIFRTIHRPLAFTI